MIKWNSYPDVTPSDYGGYLVTIRQVDEFTGESTLLVDCEFWSIEDEWIDCDQDPYGGGEIVAWSELPKPYDGD